MASWEIPPKKSMIYWGNHSDKCYRFSIAMFDYQREYKIMNHWAPIISPFILRHGICMELDGTDWGPMTFHFFLGWNLISFKKGSNKLAASGHSRSSSSAPPHPAACPRFVSPHRTARNPLPRAAHRAAEAASRRGEDFPGTTTWHLAFAE